MSHLVESMAYVGATPWHGLGHALSPGQSVDVWRQQAGMDWSIESSPVHFLTQPEGLMSGDLLEYSDHKVLYRSDSQAPLSVVGHRYQVVQPAEVLEFYRDLTEYSGFQLETAGVLKGGRKLWALARTDQYGELTGQDRIQGYLLLATACDGSMATTTQFTSIRVVCNNTLAVSLREGQRSSASCVRVRHNTRFDADAVKQQLGISVSVWSNFMSELKALSERPVPLKEAESIVQQLLATPGAPDPQKSNRKAIDRTLSQLELWMLKTGWIEPAPEAPIDQMRSPMYWGQVFEPVVAQHYTRLTGRKVRRVNAILQHPDYPWMLANLDYSVVASDEVQILECKTAGEYGAKHWKSGPPDYVHCQVQHQLAVTGKQAADVGVLICGQEFRVERDDELKTEETALKHRLQQAMAEASEAVFAQGKISFKRSQDQVTLDAKTLLNDQPELLAQYPLKKAGSRRFLVRA